MPAWRSGGELPRRQNNPAGGTAVVDPQRAQVEVGGTQVPAVQPVLVAGYTAAESAGQVQQQGRCSREAEVIGEVMETTCAACVSESLQTLAIGNAVRLPSASTAGAGCESEIAAQGAPSSPAQAAEAVTPSVVPAAPWQGVVGKEELKSRALDEAPRLAMLTSDRVC